MRRFINKYFLLALFAFALVACSEKINPEGGLKPSEEGKVELEIEIPSNIVVRKTVHICDMSFMDTTIVFEPALLMSENVVVKVETKPFEINKGGIVFTFTTIENQKLTSIALSGPDDYGKKLRDGDKYRIYVPSADPFNPCKFPVVFPLGKNPNARTGYYNYSDDQPEWFNMGYWWCFDQKQVYAKWVKVSDPLEKMQQVREMVNTGNIGSIGLKGIWTGDYFEFVFPVENIKKGSLLTFQAPFYGRQQPIFWTIKWSAGGEWKSIERDVTSWDGSTTLKASFATKPHGVVIESEIPIDEDINDNILRIRLVCSDGSYQADPTSNTVIKRDAPFNDGKIYISPFYFYCEGSGVDSITWDIK